MIPGTEDLVPFWWVIVAFLIGYAMGGDSGSSGGSTVVYRNEPPKGTRPTRPPVPPPPRGKC